MWEREHGFFGIYHLRGYYYYSISISSPDPTKKNRKTMTTNDMNNIIITSEALDMAVARRWDRKEKEGKPH